MINFQTETLFLIAAVLFLAGFVKGVIGFGLPAIAIGLLGLMMPPLQAAGLLLVPNIITNIWQMMSGGAFLTLFNRLYPLFLGILLGVAGTEFMTGGNDLAWTKTLLGLTLMTYAILGLFAIRFSLSRAHEKWGGLVGGLLTGAMTLATGVFVIPSGPYLQAIGLEKDELVQAMGMTFFVSSFALGLALMSRGMMNTTAAGASFVALIPALSAMILGQRLRTKISQQLFKKLFYIGMLMLGAFLMLKR